VLRTPTPGWRTRMARLLRTLYLRDPAVIVEAAAWSALGPLPRLLARLDARGIEWFWGERDLYDLCRDLLRYIRRRRIAGAARPALRPSASIGG